MQRSLRLVRRLGLNEIKLLARSYNRLVYGMSTCWWKVGDPVYTHPDCNLPCGPRTEMLLETNDPISFIATAEKNPQHYGKHGLDAFVAAYHGNLIVGEDGLPTSCDSWEKYNKLLDEEESRESE